MLESDTIGNLFDNYFQTVDGDTRREILLKNLGFTSTPTVEELNDKIYDLMTGSSGFDFPVEGSKLLGLATYNTTQPTDEVENAVTLAFSEYILNNL